MKQDLNEGIILNKGDKIILEGMEDNTLLEIKVSRYNPIIPRIIITEDRK